MTTYSFHLSLSETEMTVLKEALDLYIEHCEEELEKGGSGPLIYKKQAAQEVRLRLNSNPE